MIQQYCSFARSALCTPVSGYEINSVLRRVNRAGEWFKIIFDSFGK